MKSIVKNEDSDEVRSHVSKASSKKGIKRVQESQEFQDSMIEKTKNIKLD
jgi:hypothetical protein